MPNLLALNFEGEVHPSVDLRCLRSPGTMPDGWGVGYYPGGQPSASVLKEPAPVEQSIRGELVRAWDHLASSIVVLHIRTAMWGRISDADTQPFARSHGRRDWLFAHAGSLVRPLPESTVARFQAVGNTDTEAVFCEVLSRIAAQGWSRLRDADTDVLRGWLAEINTLGRLNVVLTDGADVVAYADASGGPPMRLWSLHPPYSVLRIRDADLEVDLGRRGLKARRGLVLSSDPIEVETGHETRSRDLEPGSLVLLSQGEVVVERRPSGTPAPRDAAPPRTARGRVRRVAASEVREIEVTHRTTYRYAGPVERSTHLLKLTPVHDRLQQVLASGIEVSVGGVRRDFEDEFGNQATRVNLDTPFTELTVLAHSHTRLLDTQPLDFNTTRSRLRFPLVWMPWQRVMLAPYTLPPELPDTQLAELTEYAQSFVTRNDGDVLDTLLDLNATLYEEYRYEPGSTHVWTTPFEVYQSRHGVCQDFTNLFLCIARLLGVPARYVCGYVHPGDHPESARNAQASHAWLQVYLPEVGWKGFDPTNGIVTQTDHVRVAVGRNYLDATPTQGTLFVGGGAESLTVDVRVRRVR